MNLNIKLFEYNMKIRIQVFINFYIYKNYMEFENRGSYKLRLLTLFWQLAVGFRGKRVIVSTIACSFKI